MAPAGLNIVAGLWLLLCAGVAAGILTDILIHHRGLPPVMKWVWTVSGLYLGPIAVWTYAALGLRAPEEKIRPERCAPRWFAGVRTTLVGAAGCTLAIAAAEAVFARAAPRPAAPYWRAAIAGYVLALVIAGAFRLVRQPVSGIRRPLLLDFLSVTTFFAGFLGWMALCDFVLFARPLAARNLMFWYTVQLGLLAGFAASYPVNWWATREDVRGS